MKNHDIALEWFKMAEIDFDSAKFLLAMKPVPFEIICYHCQQCVEKYLKGFIALNGGQILKTHDLVALNKECISFNNEFDAIENECIELTDYGVQVRYPFHIEIEDFDVQNAIKNTQTTVDFIKKIVERDFKN